MIRDPMFHAGWLRFNEEQWGVSAEHLTLSPDKGSGWRLETVVYRDKRGKLVNPLRNSYLPVSFETPANKPAVINRRKRHALQALASYYKKSGLKSAISLASTVDDVRPFQWSGMLAEPRFTYHIDLSCYRALADPTVFKKAKKAKSMGYSCEVTTDYEAVARCLEAPEARKDFDYRLNGAALSRAADLMGADHLVCFLARSGTGEPRGARVALYSAGGLALAWSAGIQSEALRHGVNNLMVEYALDYFSERGCRVLDFVGANIPPVAEMKEAWGGQLVHYYTVSQRNLRWVAKECVEKARSLFR